MHSSTYTAIIFSVVGLAIAAGASFVGAFLVQRFKTVSYLTSLLGLQYGFVRRRYEADYQLADDGSSIARITEVIRAINVPVSGVEHYSQILTERPNDTKSFAVESVSVRKSSGNSSEGRVIPKPTLVTPKRLYYQLLFEPTLKPKEEIEYSFDVIGPPNTFALSEDELFTRKLPYDFVSMKIAYPTEEFVMTIRFPLSLRAEDVAFDVWLGDARLRLENEYRRLKHEGCLKSERLDSGQVVRLVVKYPILDLKYVITWRPTKLDQLQPKSISLYMAKLPPEDV